MENMGFVVSVYVADDCHVVLQDFFACRAGDVQINTVF